MAALSGFWTTTTPLAGPPAPNRTGGFTFPRRNLATGGLAPPTDPTVFAEFLAAGASPPALSNRNVSGRLSEEATPGLDWFGTVHSFPRAKILFGNVISTETSAFEIFNAGRASATLTTFTNNAGAGVTVPLLPSLPDTLSPYTSLLDSAASTKLNPVKLTISVDPDVGPSSFDSTLDFLYAPGGLRLIALSGNRITFVTGEWEFPFREILEFRNTVLPKLDGSEQRINERKQPRQILETSYLLDGLDRRLMQMLLFDWHGRQFAVPLWHELMRVTQAVTGGATSTVNVNSTANVDLRVGGLAAIFADNRTFDTLEIASLTATSITFTSAIQNSYAVGDLAMPVRTAYVEGQIAGRRHVTQLEELPVRWRMSDNDTGALTADTSAFSSYGGKVLLDDPNCTGEGTSPSDLETRVSIIDNEVGVVFVDPVWTRGKRRSVKVFRVQSRQRMIQVRRLLVALRGRQVSFWLPTFIEDLLPTQNIAAASTSLVVENVDYTRFAQSREPKKTIRTTFNDGTAAIIREIQSSVETSGTEETLTLDSTWGVTKTVADIARVEFVENVRLDSDSVVIEHLFDGDARVRFPVVVVFD